MRKSYFIQTGICGYEREEALHILSKFLPSSIILFRSDFTDKDDLKKLIKDIKKLYKIENDVDPPLMAVDHEGGRVVQFPWLSYNPSNAFLGSLNDLKFTKFMGLRTGYDLKDLGFDWHISPVLDLANQYNKLSGERCFSENPENVARLGSAFIEGEKIAGVASTGKHFPCKAPSTVDTHKEIALDERSLNEILSDSYPYRYSIKFGLSAIMMGHTIHKALDADYPASLSAQACHLLRNDFKFNGVIMTDSLDMGAVRNHYSLKEIVTKASSSGVDILENVEMEQSLEMCEYIKMKDENDSARRIKALIPERTLKFSPPNELIDAMVLITNFPLRLKNALNPNVETIMVFLEEKKESAVEEEFSVKDAVCDNIRKNFPIRLVELNEIDHYDAKQAILIGRNEHFKNRISDIERLTRDRNSVFISTGSQEDIGIIPEKVGYISLLSSKSESIIGGIYRAFGLF